jgi:hypothetical protein
VQGRGLEVKSSLVEHVWVADSTVWEMSSLSLGKVDKAGWRSHRICTGGGGEGRQRRYNKVAHGLSNTARGGERWCEGGTE